METSVIQPIRNEASGALTLAGYYQRYDESNMKEIPELWDRFGPASDSLPNMMGDKYYGPCWDAFTKGKYFEYMAAIAVTSADGMPDEVTILELPAQTYFVFEHVGHATELSKTIDRIFTEWWPTTGYSQPGFPSIMEVYGADFHPPTLSGRIELWVPVQ